MAAWVKVNNVALNQKIFGKGQDYLLGISGGKVYPEIWDSSGQNYGFTAGSIPSNTWTHLAVTWAAGKQMIAYINGVEVQRVNANFGALRTSTTPLRLGTAPWDTSAFHFGGMLDEVVLLPSAIDSAGVQLLMNSTYPAISIDDDFVPFELGRNPPARSVGRPK